MEIKKIEKKASGAVLFPADTAAKAADLRDKSPAFEWTGDGIKKVISRGGKRPFSSMREEKTDCPKGTPARSPIFLKLQKNFGIIILENNKGENYMGLLPKEIADRLF